MRVSFLSSTVNILLFPVTLGETLLNEKLIGLNFQLLRRLELFKKPFLLRYKETECQMQWKAKEICMYL